MLRRTFVSSVGAFALAGLTPGHTLANANTPQIRIVGADNSPPLSSRSGERTIGYIADIINASCTVPPVIDHTLTLYPWSRAQQMVQQGIADAFCTFPSEQRQQYALFTPSPVFYLDYGNLVFRRDNPNARQIANARSWDDLKGLTFVGQYNTGWEDDNVPDFIDKVHFSDQQEMLQLLLKRNVGDFLIMNPLESNYLIRELSLTGQAQQAQVTFIENSRIPFHFGFSKKFASAESMVAGFETRITSPEFLQTRTRIKKTYASLNQND